jgi:hypothetical protein
MSAGMAGLGSGEIIKVYPNPANEGELLKVETTGNYSDLMIQLFNSQGKLIFNKTKAPQQMEISTIGLPSGLYLLRAAGTNRENTVPIRIFK